MKTVGEQEKKGTISSQEKSYRFRKKKEKIKSSGNRGKPSPKVKTKKEGPAHNLKAIKPLGLGRLGSSFFYPKTNSFTRPELCLFLSPCSSIYDSPRRHGYPFLSLLAQHRSTSEESSPAPAMECVLGLVGRDFAVVAADTSAVQSILVHKTDEDKVMVLDSHKLMGASGEPGDR